MNATARASSIALSILAAACAHRGGDGSQAGGPPAAAAQTTLSGVVARTGGAGLPGATVTLCGTVSATTDAGGRFILNEIATGAGLLLEVDPNDPRFPRLAVTLDVQGGTDNALPQVLVLPDLQSPDSAEGVGTIDTLTGEVLNAPQVDNGNAGFPIALGVPAGTVVSLDGAPPTGDVTFNVTPVPPSEVPMPLPAAEAIAAPVFVTVQPGAAAFDAGGGTGLDLTLPNVAGLAPGVELDVWSFDHDDGAWVDRTAETGRRGVVSADGSAVVAQGVLVEGGWHAAVVPIDRDCATTVRGRVVDPSGTPVAGATIAVDTGQFDRSDLDGDFSIPDVPAYVAADQPACAPTSVGLRLVTPVAAGATLVTPAPLAAVAGGVTDFGEIAIALPTTGSLVGLVKENGAGTDGLAVDVAGPTPTAVTSGPNGDFFLAALGAGDYTASVTFPGDADPTTLDFSITPARLTAICLQRIVGPPGGAGDVVVTVLRFPSGEPVNGAPVSGALVILEAANGAFQGTTDGAGRVAFRSVTGPFTVTAQADVFDPTFGTTDRYAATVAHVEPANGEIGVPIFCEGFGDLGEPSATVAGTVANAASLFDPASETLFFVAFGRDSDFQARAVVGPGGGYSLAVPPGEVLDGVLVASTTAFTATARAAVPVLGIGPVAAGATETVDVDAAAAARLDFDCAATVSTGTLPGTGQQCDAVGVVLRHASGAELSLDAVNVEDAQGPVQVLLPEAGLAAALGFELLVDIACSSLGAGAFPPSFFGECTVRPGPLATSVHFPLAPGLTPLARPQGAAIDPTVPLELSFALGAREPGLEAGLNGVFLESFSETDPTLGRICWEVWLPADETAVRLPVPIQPMFLPSSSVFYREDALRIDVPLDFDAVFDASLEARLATILGAVREECTTGAVLQASVPSN